MIRKIIHLIHIIYVAPLLIYSGYIGIKVLKRSNMDGEIMEVDTNNKRLFYLLIVTGIIVLLYHIYKLII